MGDIGHDLNVLATVAKIDATLHHHRVELQQIPVRIVAAEGKIAILDAAERESVEALEALQKERRALESSLEDIEARAKKYRMQLMEVKTNKEYTAMQHEIETARSEIDSREGRVLELMDLIDERKTANETEIGRIGRERDTLKSECASLLAEQGRLKSEYDVCAADKPRVIKDLDLAVLRRYERVLQRHGDTAVVNADGDYCGGCGTQLPPQVAVEVRKSNQILDCQSCGRLLVHLS